MIAVTDRYARALVAQKAAELRDAIHVVQARETDNITIHKLAEVCAECAWCEMTYGENEIKEGDELKAKLSTAQNYEAVIAAKDREIEGVKEERNRLNAKVNELMKKLEDSE